jgi:hypothetical protein
MTYAYMNSAMVSKYYPMFCLMGYPQLDIIRYEDGEWSIIEYENAPLVPALTKWKHVLTGLRNIEITEGFVRKYVRQIDPQFQAFWDRERERTEKMEAEKEYLETQVEEKVDAVVKQLSKNDDLKERIAKNGPGELALEKLALAIPEAKLKREIRR